MIRTGLETREDMDAFLEEIEDMLKIRSEVGANTAIQFSFTPLVIYDDIPLRYEPRITARESLENSKTMGYFLDEVHKLAEKYDCYIRVKFNGRGPGTFIEQSLIDGGRTYTKVLVRMSLDDNLDYQRNFGDAHRDSLIKWCDHYHIDYRDIFRERAENEIFWSDSIQFVTEKRIKEWHDMHLKHDYAHGYCLKTNSSKGRCYACGTCPTPQDIKEITTRELPHIPVEKVISDMLTGKRVRSITRFVFNKKDEWKIYSNETLAHYITSQFLQLDDRLVDAFHIVKANSSTWLAQNDQKDWYSGYVVFDVEWKDLVSANELKQYVSKVNEKLHIGKIVNVFDIDEQMELSTKAYVQYIIPITDRSLGYITEKFNNFDWQVKQVTKGAAGPEVIKKYMPELKSNILFVPHGSSVLAYMNLPITVSPYYVLSSMFGMNVHLCMGYTPKVVGVSTPSDLVCKNDGNTAMYDCLKNVQLSECAVCRGKKLLYVLTHK